MDTPRRKLILAIFEAALAESKEKRQEFVHASCNGDSELESEIDRLLRADAAAGSFLETYGSGGYSGESAENASQQALASGSLLSGRFRIVRLLGEGGMGQVYEAVDLELKQRIALKTIKRELSSDVGLLARFKKEVRLARQITHPNVCRTFDFNRHCEAGLDGAKTEVMFLTMELLSGQTLSEALRKQGKLKIDEALPVARQMADALSAAHKAGIIHRDLKPSNVVLMPELGMLRVVVTDFGLARALQPESQISDEALLTSAKGTEHLLGTLLYMAPELFEGREATTASDIYSFGLILFEIITGRRPFADENSFIEVVKRLREPAPSAQKYEPDFDAKWSKSIARCLEEDPLNRFASVQDVVAGLTDDASVLPRWSPVREAGTTLLPQVSKRKLGKRLVMTATAIVVVALFLVSLRYYQRVTVSTAGLGAGVLMTELRNSTNDSRFNATTELLTEQLTQSPYFNLWDKRRVNEVLARMEKPAGSTSDPVIAREVALRSGVSRVIFGSISRVSDTYVLDVVIEQPDNNPARSRARWVGHWTWNGSQNRSKTDKTLPADYLLAMRNCSDWIRKNIGELPDDIAKLGAPPEDITPDKWEALTEYVTAEQFESQGDSEGAVTALQNAVRLDPGFALAQMRLGDLLNSLGRFDESYAAYALALKAGSEHRLTRRENYRLQGIRAFDAGNFSKAEDTFRNYTVYYKTDYLGWFYRAYPLMMLGRVEEAIQSLTKAGELNPGGMSSPAHLARFNLILGNFAGAEEWISRLRKQGFSSDADIVEGESSFLRGDYDRAKLLFEGLEKAPDALYRSMGFSFEARLSAERGEYHSAIRTLTAGIADDVATGDLVHRADKLLDRSYVQLQLGQISACLEDLELALNLDRSFERSMAAAAILGRAAASSRGPMRKAIISSLYRLRDRLPKAEFGPLSDIANARVVGEILLVNGKAVLALEQFRKAATLDSPVIEHEYLARGLWNLARVESNPQQARAALKEAEMEYGKTVARPGQIWQWSLDYPPGFLSDETFNHFSLMASTGKADDGTMNEIRAYLERRKNSDPGIGSVESARRPGEFTDGRASSLRRKNENEREGEPTIGAGYAARTSPKPGRDDGVVGEVEDWQKLEDW